MVFVSECNYYLTKVLNSKNNGFKPYHGEVIKFNKHESKKHLGWNQFKIQDQKFQK